jgi:hypothetical protein
VRWRRRRRGREFDLKVPRTGLRHSALLVLPARGAEVADSLGRHVIAPEHVARIIPAGPPADVLMYALAEVFFPAGQVSVAYGE